MLKQTIVLYRSHYGSTKRYAQWIAKALACQAADIRHFNLLELANYDTVILGGGLYASRVNISGFISKHRETLKGKRTALFVVGITEPHQRDQLDSAIAKALPPNLPMPTFYFTGAMNEKRLKPFHRLLTRMVRKSLEKKGEALSAHERRFLSATQNPCDFTDEAQTAPLVAVFMP